MRMARAFIASVPMAIVLVAAVVVPLAVIPGTFGFQAWPSSHGDRITEHRVHEKPRVVKVVQDGPARAATATRGRAGPPPPRRSAPPLPPTSPPPREAPPTSSHGRARRPLSAATPTSL